MLSAGLKQSKWYECGHVSQQSSSPPFTWLIQCDVSEKYIDSKERVAKILEVVKARAELELAVPIEVELVDTDRLELERIVCTAVFGWSWQKSGNPDHLLGVLQLGVPSILFGVLLYLFGHYIVSKN